jgi:ParB/RepB/Spo0J family partition protein
MQELEELAATIRVLGVLEPLVVVPLDSRPGYFEIRDGERRWRASKMAGLATVPVVVRQDLGGTARAALTRVIANGHRVDHGPVELAKSFGELLDAGMTQADIARVTGYKRSTVSYHCRLLRADEKTLDLVREGRLKVGAVHDAVRGAAGPAGRGAAGTRPARPPPAVRPGALHRLPPARGRRGPALRRPWAPAAGPVRESCLLPVLGGYCPRRRSQRRRAPARPARRRRLMMAGRSSPGAAGAGRRGAAAAGPRGVRAAGDLFNGWSLLVPSVPSGPRRPSGRPARTGEARRAGALDARPAGALGGLGRLREAPAS